MEQLAYILDLAYSAQTTINEDVILVGDVDHHWEIDANAVWCDVYINNALIEEMKHTTPAEIEEYLEKKYFTYTSYKDVWNDVDHLYPRFMEKYVRE